MKIITPDPKFLEKVKLLTDKEYEHILSRMGKKCRRRQDKQRLTNFEALAIYLESEDEKLREWRERMISLNQQNQ